MSFAQKKILPGSRCSFKRDYFKADWDLFRTLLANVNWNAVFCDGDIDKVCSKFKQKLAECTENSTPMKKRKPWRLKSNPKIRTTLRYIRRCNAIYKSSKSRESLVKLINAKERLQQLIDQQILYYETHIVTSLRDNPKRYWSYVNSKLANKDKCFSAIKTNQGTINDPETIAEEMNNFFIAVLIKDPTTLT